MTISITGDSRFVYFMNNFATHGLGVQRNKSTHVNLNSVLTSHSSLSVSLPISCVQAGFSLNFSEHFLCISINLMILIHVCNLLGH